MCVLGEEDFDFYRLLIIHITVWSYSNSLLPFYLKTFRYKNMANNFYISLSFFFLSLNLESVRAVEALVLVYCSTHDRIMH